MQQQLKQSHERTYPALVNELLGIQSDLLAEVAKETGWERTGGRKTRSKSHSNNKNTITAGSFFSEVCVLTL